MDTDSAKKLIQDTLENSFNKEKFNVLVKNIFNQFTEKALPCEGNNIPKAFQDSIKLLNRIGQYKDSNNKIIDVLIVRLKEASTLERARSKQRNFISWYLKSCGSVLKDGALVAFVSPSEEDWRFSFVCMEYKYDEEKKKIKEEWTPARRYSFLVGKNEKSHTAKTSLLSLLVNEDPKMEDLEEAFGVEKVTKEFYQKYRELFNKLKESLEAILKRDIKIREEFRKKKIDLSDFSKKLLGQIVFLYFLQKKGWFGVQKGQKWGTGSKTFLRDLFKNLCPPKSKANPNFFNDILEPLFYEALSLEHQDDYYRRFNCHIPFLNGGLFEPIKGYDWVKTDILLPNSLFSNEEKTKEGDEGTGILDIFDRYNFTVKEDEPLEKEVAIDPEMLGKVFENLLEVKDRKSKGTYYTPREIVHYMCQESLINCLFSNLNSNALGFKASTTSFQDVSTATSNYVSSQPKTSNTQIKIPKKDIEEFVKRGSDFVEYNTISKLPEAVEKYAFLIDQKLADIHICDPAVGSGAFLVGMMNEIVRLRTALTPFINSRNTDSKERTNYHFKRHAIEQSLYGVDIDSGAIEIAKLRLWLSLVVDEEDRNKIQALPNLDYKMVCGNSLLSVEKDLLNYSKINKLEDLKSNYFNETLSKEKQKLKKQIDQLITELTNKNKTFDFEVYFSEVFNKKQGFDVVIANPPYVQLQKDGGKLAKLYQSKKYETFEKTGDIYCLFYEKAFEMINLKGCLSFITSNK